MSSEKSEQNTLSTEAILIARKKFMTTRFDSETGKATACTVLEIEPNVVVGIKEFEGRKFAQIGSIKDKGGSEKSIINRIGKPMFGVFKKANVDNMRVVHEFEVTQDDLVAGSIIDASVFEGVKSIDVTGKSKGKGFQGVVKKYGMAGGPASHGSSRFHRGRGSLGQRSTPGRCFKLLKMAGRMGGYSTTVQNLDVMGIITPEELGVTAKVEGSKWLLVKGAVPGCPSSIVKIRSAIKTKKG